MARYSANGWPVLTKDETAVIRVAGGAFRIAPACAPVFAAFIARYDAEVEDLSGPVLDDWSWADRLVRGSTTSISNHASATAVDLNATRHPRGSRGTFTDAQDRAIRRLRADFPVLRYGGTFRTVPDEMHWEIDASPAEVAAFVASLNPPEDTVDAAQEDRIAAKTAEAVTHVLIPDLTDTPTVGKVSLGTALGKAQRWALQTALGTSKAGVAHAEALNTLTEHVTALTGQVTALQDAVAALTPPPPVGG